MNPRSKVAQSRRVTDELRRIREAWPEGQVTHSVGRMSATVLIREPSSTYIIAVEAGDQEVETRSLWVSHRVPIGPDSEHVPDWAEGWVD